MRKVFAVLSVLAVAGLGTWALAARTQVELTEEVLGEEAVNEPTGPQYTISGDFLIVALDDFEYFVPKNYQYNPNGSGYAYQSRDKNNNGLYKTINLQRSVVVEGLPVFETSTEGCVKFVQQVAVGAIPGTEAQQIEYAEDPYPRCSYQLTFNQDNFSVVNEYTGVRKPTPEGEEVYILTIAYDGSEAGTVDVRILQDAYHRFELR